MSCSGRRKFGSVIRCSLALAACALLWVDSIPTASASSVMGPPKGNATSTISKAGTGNPASEDYRGPESWIHGLLTAAPAADLSATGTRGITNLRGFIADEAIKKLQGYAARNMSVCMTLRWKSPADDKIDTPPTGAEAAKAINDIVKVVSSAEARSMGSKLWIQFYNEVSGGPGRFELNQADAMLGFATELTKKIREANPAVRICGPALTGVEVLAKDQSKFDQMAWDRYNGLHRVLDWSIANADAVDVHLHCSGKDEARINLRIVRDTLNVKPGGSAIPLLALEWSPARYPDRNNSAGVRQAIVDIWQTMAEYKVVAGAYGSYGVGEQSDMFRWKSLMDESNQPRQPFNQTFLDIAQGKVEMAPGSEGSGDSKSTATATQTNPKAAPTTKSGSKIVRKTKK